MPLTSPGGVPINAKFFDDNGNIARVWINFLAGLGIQVPVPVVLVDGLNPYVFVGNSPEIIITGPAADFSIGGFSAGINGQRLHVLNYTDQPMTLEDLSTDSPAGDQIVTLTGADVTLAGKSSATFIYYNVSPISDVNPPGAWVLEATAPSSGDSTSVKSAQPSATLTPLTTGYQDLASFNVTLDKAGVWRVDAVLQMNFQAAAGGVLAQLVLGATPQTRIFQFLSSADFAGVGSTFWYVTSTGSTVAKIQAKASVAAGTRQVVKDYTFLGAQFLHP